MIERARAEQVITIVVAELTAYLESDAGPYDLIASADTLVYFGDLRPLPSCRRRAEARRPVVFTVERADWQTRREQAGFFLNLTADTVTARTMCTAL